MLSSLRCKINLIANNSIYIALPSQKFIALDVGGIGGEPSVKVTLSVTMMFEQQTQLHWVCYRKGAQVESKITHAAEHISTDINLLVNVYSGGQ